MHIHALLFFFSIQSGLWSGVRWNDCLTGPPDLIHLRSHGRNLASATALQKSRSTHIPASNKVFNLRKYRNGKAHIGSVQLWEYFWPEHSPQTSMTVLSCRARISWRALKKSSYPRSTAKFDIRVQDQHNPTQFFEQVVSI